MSCNFQCYVINIVSNITFVNFYGHFAIFDNIEPIEKAREGGKEKDIAMHRS